MPKVIIGHDVVAAAMRSSKVRPALAARRDQVLGNARRIAAAAGAAAVARSLRSESGTRPGTKATTGIRRPFERVTATAPDAADREYGNVGVRRDAIMRRAAGE